MHSGNPTHTTYSQSGPRMADPHVLVKRLLSNPELAGEMTDEELRAVQQHINPYGDVVTTDESFATLSLINFRDQYHRKYLMTGLIGYMYRLAFEYKPAEIDDIETDYERRAGACTDGEERKRLMAEKTALIDDYTKTSRRVIERFLNKNFNYNPDRHVRAAHTDNKTDPERTPKDELIRQRCAVAKRARKVESVMRSNVDKTFATTRNIALGTYQQARDAVSAIDAVIKTAANAGITSSSAGAGTGALALDDALVILNRARQKLDGAARELSRITEPLSAADTLACVKVNPPQDVFFHFDRYLTNHYEHIRDAVASLYSEKPDFEYAVIYYGSHDNEKDARDYRVQHESEFKAATFTVSNRGITLLGPFKQNRERVDFYNKNTDILKQMMEQMELDHKLGKDLMEKAVKKEKSKNIAQTGLDPKGLKEYARIQHEITGLTARKVLTEEDERELHRLTREKEQLEVPPDMIMMDVFKTVDDIETGEAMLERDIYYTQAEAPLHLQENSEYTSKYQPNKRLRSRTGQTTTLGELRGDGIDEAS